MLAKELGIAKDTAERYAIDCLAARENVDHKRIATYLQISTQSFRDIKCGILFSVDCKLRTIHEDLKDRLKEFSYNQIRYVLACLIQELNI